MAIVAGASVSEYWNLTFGEYGALIEGLKYKFDYEHSQHKEILLLLREILTMIYNVNAGKGKQKTGQQLLPFKSEPQEEIGESELKKRLEKISKEPKTLDAYLKHLKKKKK